MSVDGTRAPRRARHVAPLAMGLVFVVAGTACLFAGHGHFPGVEMGRQATWDAHPDHTPPSNGCTICSIAQHAAAALTAPQAAAHEHRVVGPKRSRLLPRAADPLADEQSPRAPPRAAIG